ncbi:TetR/AcrR family transcriptional regulator [Corynebacterium sp. NPDC060344]|uniref:TetR/AcrR family transcriptional regulator n=1 Tax=Corynebacterium sp. NPDC060344 TaxID=3347101 RepID=UPI00364CCFF3
MRKIQSPPGLASRSRDKLRAAAATLLDQREPTDVTITDLVNEAGVSRPTFYAVYRDLSEAWADAAVLRLEQAFDGIDPAADGFDTGDIGRILEVIGTAVARLEPHVDFMHRVLAGPGGPEVLRQSIDYLAARILAAPTFGARLAGGPLAPETAARAIAASIAWTAVQWASDEDRGPLADLVADLGVLLVRGVDGGLGEGR